MNGDFDEPLPTAGGSAAVVRSFYRALETGDHEPAIRPLLSPQVVWHVAGQNPLAGAFRGHSEVFKAMRRYAQRSKGTLRLNTQSILGDGLHAVAIHAATGKRNGKSYSAHEIDVFHVKDGLIIEIWSFSEDQAATDAMWS